MGQAIYHHLCTISIPQAKKRALQAITLLARNHTPELVAAFLDFSITLDRCPVTHSILLQAGVMASAPSWPTEREGACTPAHLCTQALERLWPPFH
jgi:hypothetical protein